jgi:hypothetical protein
MNDLALDATTLEQLVRLARSQQRQADCDFRPQLALRKP